VDRGGAGALNYFSVTIREFGGDNPDAGRVTVRRGQRESKCVMIGADAREPDLKWPRPAGVGFVHIQCERARLVVDNLKRHVKTSRVR
jgi:hypothetical protein